MLSRCWCRQINSLAQKYITYALDVIKMVWYNHVKVGIPETISQNKIIVLGQYATKLEKVNSPKVLRKTAFFLFIKSNNYENDNEYSKPSLTVT